MPTRRLLLENYRAFRERQEIEFAPVTVVLGKNISGKSALVRAPLVIAGSLVCSAVEARVAACGQVVGPLKSCENLQALSTGDGLSLRALNTTPDLQEAR